MYNYHTAHDMAAKQSKEKEKNTTALFVPSLFMIKLRDFLRQSLEANQRT